MNKSKEPSKDGSWGCGAATTLPYREEGCRSAVVKTFTHCRHHLLIVRMAKLFYCPNVSKA